MIKVITFDLDGVYFPKGKYNFIAKVVDLGVLESEVKRVFLNSSQMNEQYKKGKMNDSEFWTWALNEWGLQMPWQDIVSIMISSYDIDEEVVKFVKKLKKEGYMTAICTSNFPARINGLNKRFGFLDNFDIKVISYEVGENKPDIKIFKKLIELSNVDPEEIVYSDDHSEVLEVAKSLGIKTYTYDNLEGYIKFINNCIAH